MINFSLLDCPRHVFRNGFFCLVLLHVVTVSTAQDTTFVSRTDSTCVDRQKDVTDLLRQWMKKPPKPPKISTGSLLLVPVISSNPANGFLFGAAGQYAFKTKGANSLYSSLNGSVNVTTKKQLIIQV